MPVARQPDAFSDFLENLLVRVLVMSKKLFPQEQPFWGQNGRNVLWQRSLKLLLFWFKFLCSGKPLLEEKSTISSQLFSRGGGIAIDGLLGIPRDAPSRNPLSCLAGLLAGTKLTPKLTPINRG